MRVERKMKAWIELEKEREAESICNGCFRRTLKIILGSRAFKQLNKKGGKKHDTRKI